MRVCALILLLVLPLHAAVIGFSEPAQSLTAARVEATLPAARRQPWLDYLRVSDEQMARDKAALSAERKGLEILPTLPGSSNSAKSIPLDRDGAFYGSAAARHIGDVILSFQTPAGGWSKNLDMGGPARLRGQSYAGANVAPVPSAAGDFDTPRDEHWHYVGTLDNDATNTEIHFLAKLSSALTGRAGDAYRAGALRGLEYLLNAQYPNGGWPQVWPLEGGYHDAITFNDDAVTESAEVLTAAARGTHEADEDWSFVPASVRFRAGAAAEKALQCILATQVRVPSAGGEGTVLTVWAQQHDALTLKPVAGRNFEPAALSSGESASVLEYLLHIESPTPAVVASIQSAAAWFQSHKVVGHAWSGGRSTPGGRRLSAVPGAGPLWARYYSLTTGEPVFGDRDKSIHDDVMELSLERRNGYAWFGEAPARALAGYAEWARARHIP